MGINKVMNTLYFRSVNEIKSSIADLTDRVKSLEQLDSPALSSKSSIKCPKNFQYVV